MPKNIPQAPSAGQPSGELTIMHVVRSPVGGIFRHIRDLALAQTRAGHRVGIICDATTGGLFEANLIAGLGPKLDLGIIRFPMRRAVGFGDMAAFWRVYGHCRRIRPDIIHTHGSKGGAYGRLAAAIMRLRGFPVRVFYAPHGGSLHHDPNTLSGRFFFFIERLLERLSDGLVHVCAFEAQTYRAKVGRPQCMADIVHNGLAPAEFRLVEPAPDAADFLYVGMLRDLKGVDLFIEALATLHACGFAATAHIVGEGTAADERRYRRQVEELGLSDAIAFHAPMPARRAFTMGQAIVVPSRAESLPYIVLEAAAAGVPMVASRVGGIPEIFATQADRLVPPDDVAALQCAMLAILVDPRTARAQADRLRDGLKTRFAVAHMARRIDAIYRAAERGAGSRLTKAGMAPASRA